MKTYAYINPSYTSESVSDEIKKLIPYNCDEYLIEEVTEEGDRQLESLLEVVSENDRVIVTKLSNFGMKLREFNELLFVFSLKSVELLSIEDDFSSISSISLHKITSALTKMESERLSTVFKRRKNSADCLGKDWGRPAISHEKIQLIQWLYESEKMTMREISQKCEVSLGTVHKYINSKDASRIQVEAFV